MYHISVLHVREDRITVTAVRTSKFDDYYDDDDYYYYYYYYYDILSPRVFLNKIWHTWFQASATV